MVHFDNTPTVYWLCGYVLAGIVVLSAYHKKVSPTLFMVISLLLLLVMRLPVIVFNRELNPDESQMLSHALTLYQEPVYWQSADGTTIGPLSNYLLVIPKLFGFQIDYTAGRAMGLLCTAVSLLLLFQTLRNFFGDKTARACFLLPLFFLSFTQEVDFVHYSSEQLPVLLLSVCLWHLSKLLNGTHKPGLHSYLLGLFAGMVPFAKLQAVPQALAIVLCTVWVCFHILRADKNRKPLLAILSGGITFPLLVLAWTLLYHVFDDLIDFYILGNVIYAGGNSAPSIPAQFFKIMNLSPDFKAYTGALLVPVLASLWYLVKGKAGAGEQQHYIIPVTVLLLALTSIYAVTKSGNDFIHYLNFCIAPWTLLGAFGMNKLGGKRLVIPAFFLLWFLAGDAYAYRKYHTINSFVSEGTHALPQSTVTKELKKYTREKDFMAVWGWQCSYYVEAQLAEGTAENHSERSIFKHDMQEKYKSRYLSDIQRTTPAVFLDAVGKNSFWVQDRPSQGYENFPELADYINRNYTYRGIYDDTRLYVRNDRL